jgi:hypothetical protein
VIVRTSLIAVLVVLTASTARAQTDPPLHRLQLGAGVGFFGGATLGDADANLRTSSSDPFRLFATSSRQAGTIPLDLHAAVDLTRRFGVEAHTLFARPDVHTSVSDDAESAPSVDAVERLDQYVFDGGIVVRLSELRMKSWEPFATAGAGYLRQLHEGLTLSEHGQVFYFGGGVRRVLMLRPKGLFRGLGIRGDVRLNVLSDGITVEDKRRNHFSASASVFVVF